MAKIGPLTLLSPVNDGDPSPIPSDVYLDSSVILASIIQGDPHSVACVQYCSDLAANNSAVYFSQVLRIEVAHVIRSLATRSATPISVQQQFQLSRFNSDMLVRQQWMTFGMRQFENLLKTFYIVYELPIRKRIQQQSIKLMSLHNLDSHDAIHIATAHRNAIPDFAAVDGDFSRVTGMIRIHIIR